MKKLFNVITSFALIAATYILLGGVSVSAQGSAQSGAAAAHGTGTPSTLFGSDSIVNSITNILLFVAGALAVIMIIWGGLRYTTSGGNASSVTAAKNTVIYAVVGLIIAFLAYAVVNFVLAGITPGGSGSGFTNV